MVFFYDPGEARTHDLHPVKIRNMYFTSREYREESESYQGFIGYFIFSYANPVT